MNPIPLANKNFQRIIQFYMFESPVRTFKRTTKPIMGSTTDQPHPKYSYEFVKVSKRGITFAERDLDGAKLNSLRAAMMRVTDVKLMAVDDGVREKARELNDLETPEYIIIKRNENNVSETEGYFYCIRNAFAHGDFDIESTRDGKHRNPLYILKNESGGKVKGVARLKESSLLAWVDLVNMSIEDIKKAGR